MPDPNTITLSDEVRAAINAGRPVVALESTLLAHGLSYPANIDLAREVDAIVRDAGAIPATVAVIRGLPTIGSDDEAMAILTQNPGISKLSARDLPIAMGTGIDGATTVASTAALAAAVASASSRPVAWGLCIAMPGRVSTSLPTWRPWLAPRSSWSVQASNHCLTSVQHSSDWKA